MFVEIGNDSENLAFQIIQPLRIGPDAGHCFTGTAVAAFQVHDAPIRIASPGGRIEDHVAHRMQARIHTHPQDLARGAFEGRV